MDDTDLPTVEMMMSTLQSSWNSRKQRSQAAAVDQHSTSKAAMASIHFVDNADLEFIVGTGEEAVHFYASSMKVENAAPGLLATIIDYLQADLNSARRFTCLPYVDATAFRILMLVCHHQFDKMPRTIGFEALHKLAEIMDQFDVASVLTPFSTQWLARLAEFEVDAAQPEWLLTSWIFGMQSLFTSCFGDIVNKTYLDDD